MDGREPKGLKIGDCIVHIDGPAVCDKYRVGVAWLDGYYVVGDWLCEEVSGLCVKVPTLGVALERLRRGIGVVRAEVFY